MSPLSEVGLVTWREVKKSFRSTKGAALAAISVLGGGAVSMLLAWIDYVRRLNAPVLPDFERHQFQEEFFSRVYSPAVGKALASCPYPLWMTISITLWLAPLLVALMTFDAVSGDLQRGTVRFWTVRTRRSSYLFGKALGAWGAVLAISLGMNVIVWGVMATVGHLDLVYVAGWGLRFFAILVPVTAAWCAIAVLVGSQIKTPTLALLGISVTFFAIWMVSLAARVQRFQISTQHDPAAGLPELPTPHAGAWFLWIYPGAYDVLLLSSAPSDVGRGLLGLGLITGLAITAAVLAFGRKDI